MLSDSTRYWVIVASRDHVQVGRGGGFCQASHGKEAPLKRMKRGDWVAFYSPKETFGGSERCRRFTAIGSIKDDVVYQVSVAEGFRPFRRNVEFSQAVDAPVEPLVPSLSFIRNKKSWGYAFKFGFFEIPREDFQTIAERMLLPLSSPVDGKDERIRGVGTHP